MDFLKAQLTRLQQQLATLTASQKMLVMALVAIMVITFVWWGKYSGQSEMEEVLAQDFAAEDLSRITLLIASKGIAYKTSGSRVLVPAERKIEVLADLTYAQLLPRDTSSAFDEIISKMSSPIDAPSKTDMIQNHAKEVMLAQMIRFFPKVRSAMVVIDPTIKRNFGADSIMPSATVNIQLKGAEKFDKHLVEAAADVVAGSVAGIERKHIKVIIDGASHTVDDDADGGFAGGSYMDRVREWESYYSRNVQQQLFYIDGAMVHVTVAVSDELKKTEAVDYDPKKVAKAETSITSKTEESGSATRSGGDPGVTANAGLQVPGAGGTPSEQQKSTTDESVTLIEPRFSSTHVSTTKGPGTPTVQTASVALPRSYFAKIYQRNYQTDKEPPDGVLLPFIDKQLPGIRSSVRACLNVPTDDAIVVDIYTDLMPVIADTSVQASSGVSMLIGSHAKEIALGALALVSLFMVSMMVRKSGPTPLAAEAALAEAGLVAGAAGKSGNKAIIGEEAAEVAEGVSSLDGVELDDETLRGQQVVEQVSTLVKENPDAAANLVKRWMNRV